MKKWLSILMILGLLASFAAMAEPAATEAALDGALLPGPEEVEALAAADEFDSVVAVRFEEGFGLSVPEGWVSYPVSDEDRAGGIRYALGDGSGSRYLYVQAEPTAISDNQALSDAVAEADGLDKTGDLEFGGQPFVAFIDTSRNVSCCATIWDHELVVFMFTPQTDADYMLTASRLMETFTAA